MENRKTAIYSALIGAVAMVVAALIQSSSKEPAAPTPASAESAAPVAPPVKATKNNDSERAEFPRIFRQALAYCQTQEADYRAEALEWTYQPNAYRGKIIAKSSRFVVSADFSVPYLSEVGIWEYGFALFRQAENYTQILVRSDNTWRLSNYKPLGAMEIRNDELSALATDLTGINRTRLVVLDNEALLTINDETVGPFRLPEEPGVGPSSLIVGFEEENPFIKGSIFSVANVHSCEVPGGKLLSAETATRPVSPQEAAPPQTPSKGGKSGELVTRGETRATGLSVFLKNFRAEATFTPEALSASALELGFLFRFAANNKYLKIIANTEGRWLLTSHDSESRRVLGSGEFVSSSISLRAPTRLVLSANDGRGRLSINSSVDIDFELPEPYEAGDVGVAAKVQGGTGKPSTVRFRDFRVERQ